MKVVFMGTPEFAVPALRALIASKHEVIAAYSQPPRPAGRGMKLTPSPVHQLAEQHGIPVFTPVTLRSLEEFSHFCEHEADIAVVAAYGLILPQAILDAPRYGCINIHPSALPRGRGAAPIQRTLIAGDTETDCCIIQLEPGLDTGPVLLREPFTIPTDMDAGGLHDAMAEIGAAQVLKVLDGLENGTISKQPQADRGVTYAEKITKADRELSWDNDALTLRNRIRGLSPAPCATIDLNGETIKVFKAEVAPGDPHKPVGITLDDQLLINAGGGTALRLTELQRPGKGRQPSSQLLQGFPVPAGMVIQSHIDN